MAAGDENASLLRPRFDNSFSYGQVLQALTMVVGLASLIYAMGAAQEKQDARLQALAVSYDKLETIVAPIARANELTNHRITALEVGLSEQRQSNTGIMNKLGNISEDVAGIKARLPEIEAGQWQRKR
jgi:CII-binding regulator of phage lambda lysogenization HflD